MDAYHDTLNEHNNGRKVKEKKTISGSRSMISLNFGSHEQVV